MRPPVRIDISGVIASGKSTLAAAISNCGAFPVFEDFSRNPFFELFYSNPGRYAFEAEITYMLQHYSSILDAKINGARPVVVVDFSLVLDLAYARVTLRPDELAVFETVFDHALSRIERPDFLIKLDCSPEVELARIRERARPAERTITLDYLRELNESVEQVLMDRRFEGQKVLRIDSNKLDFRPGGKDRETVVSRVLASINL